jgi:hypothetical protein
MPGQAVVLIIVRWFGQWCFGTRTSHAPPLAYQGQHETRMHGHGCHQGTQGADRRRPAGEARKPAGAKRRQSNTALWQAPDVVSVPYST